MTTEVIIAVSQVTPTWLTQVLSENGYLTRGEVVQVSQIERYDMFSTSIVLEVTYSSDVPEATPSRFFLKMSQPETQPLNNREVMFYTHVAAIMPESPAVRCYHAAYDTEAGSYHLLLEDVSQTHFTITHPLPPTRSQVEQMVDLLAKFHTFWWDHPRLGKDAGALVTDGFIKSYIKRVENKFEQFVDFMGDRLSSKRMQMYKQSFARHPILLSERIVNQKHITFVHGDAHAWNFLLPKVENNGRTYLIDWHTFDFEPQCWLGAGDLAYMICHYWYPERRHALEKDLLKRYHERLLEYGVVDYSWEALWYDYRLSAILSLYIPVLRSNPRLVWNWYPQFEKATSAFDDLDCAELLGN